MKIGIVGDLHGQFNQVDIQIFNQSEYDLLLFTGDLCRYVNPFETLSVAGRVAELTVPTIVLPGNHDVANSIQFFGEITGRRWVSRLAGWRHLWFHKQVLSGHYS